MAMFIFILFNLLGPSVHMRGHHILGYIITGVNPG